MSRRFISKTFIIEDLIGVGDGPIPVRLLLSGLTATVEQATQEGFTELFFLPGYERDEEYGGDVEACVAATRLETEEERQARESQQEKKS
jgi:hypothetical protein